MKNWFLELRSSRAQFFWFIQVAVASMGLLFAFAFWDVAHSSEELAQRLQFERRVAETTAEVESHLADYQSLLRGGAGLFAAAEGASRVEWHDFVQQLAIADFNPGMTALGFVRWIPGQELEAHVSRVRKEGYPQYKVHPEGERENFTSIEYIEPFTGRNLRAFGLDMYSEPVRRQAMAASRDLGKPMLSGKVSLLQEADAQMHAGTLLYLPVYRARMPLTTVTERREALIGWIYTPFRMRTLMESLLAGKLGDCTVELFDETVAPANLLFEHRADLIRSIPDYKPSFSQVSPLKIAGRTWQIRVQTLPAFDALYGTSKSRAVLWSGIFLTALCMLIVGLLLRTRERANKLAARISAAARESENHIRAVLDNTADVILSTDIEGRIQSVNRSIEAVLGYPPGALVGTSVHALLPARHREAHSRHVAERGVTRPAVGVVMRRDTVALHHHGHEVPVQVTASLIELNGEKQFVVLITDISQRVLQHERMEHAAHHDSLTGLPNRRLLNDRLTQAMRRAKRNERNVALLLIDLDGFKTVNDTHGHDAGDAVLTEVSRRLSAAVRASDSVARLGGDEFVVLLDNLLDGHQAALIAEGLVAALAESITWPAATLKVSASIGIALYPGDAESADELFKRADAAMYEAKRAGKNAFRFASERALRLVA
jgi:diguanylate cyclase (GGDEF)-like protein/PAS domain S-box-containing protein